MTTNRTIEIRPSEQQILEILPSTSTSDLNSQCDVCSKSFKNRSARRFHLMKSHGWRKEDFTVDIWSGIDHKLGVPTSREKNLSLRFFCPRCSANRSYASSKLLLQHFQKTHQDKRYRCLRCTARFSLQRDLTYHTKKMCPFNRLAAAQEEGFDRAKSTERASSGKNRKTLTSVETQTESNWEAEKQKGRAKLLLVPVKVVHLQKYRKILPRPPPQPTSCTTTTSTQVDHSFTNFNSNSDSNYYNSQSQSHNTLVDIGLQADFSFYSNQPERSFDNLQQLAYPIREKSLQQQQDSFSQTSYPQTVDFGMQCHPYPQQPQNVQRMRSANALDLPPLNRAAIASQTDQITMSEEK